MRPSNKGYHRCCHHSFALRFRSRESSFGICRWKEKQRSPRALLKMNYDEGSKQGPAFRSPRLIRIAASPAVIRKCASSEESAGATHAKKGTPKESTLIYIWCCVVTMLDRSTIYDHARYEHTANCKNEKTNIELALAIVPLDEVRVLLTPPLAQTRIELNRLLLRKG